MKRYICDRCGQNIVDRVPVQVKASEAIAPVQTELDYCGDCFEALRDFHRSSHRETVRMRTIGQAS